MKFGEKSSVFFSQSLNGTNKTNRADRIYGNYRTDETTASYLTWPDPLTTYL